MTIAFPISLEDKRKLSFNYMKGETKIQAEIRMITQKAEIWAMKKLKVN